MEPMTMGKIVVAARIENVVDLYAASKGQIPDDQVHRLEVADAQVDTGASHLGMPRHLIEKLDIPRIATGRDRTTAGIRSFDIYGPVRLTVQGRFCSIDVAEVADECPVLIGYVPLELLDFVVNPKTQSLTGNPDHGGDFLFDMF